MVNPAMDPLSDILRGVRLWGGIFLDARFTAPWSVTAKIEPASCPGSFAKPAHVIGFHVVQEGRFLVSLAGEPHVEVKAGEIILFPGNGAHVMASERGLPAVSADSLVQSSPDAALARIEHGGGGDAARLMCGFLGSDQAFDPLIAGLPPLLKLDVREGTSRDWIEASVRFAAAELAAGRLPTSDLLSRLSETLLVEAVRTYAADAGDIEVGWLKGLRDPQIGRALALIHDDIGASLSVEALAREAAMSRSAFVDRFRAVVGVPPIRYLTAWRLYMAKAQLRETARSVGQLAHAVGYDSEEAFSRAFKREFGVSPARWRAEVAGG